MKTFLTIAATTLALSAPAFAEGDAAEGEKTFRKCKSCHKIESPDGDMIVKGGRTGPNLYGVIGRVAGTEEDFRYGSGLEDAAAAEFVWTEEEVATYIADPKAWLEEKGFDKKSKMSFRLRKGGEDVAAFLASVAPAPEEGEEDAASE